MPNYDAVAPVIDLKQQVTEPLKLVAESGSLFDLHAGVDSVSLIFLKKTSIIFYQFDTDKYVQSLYFSGISWDLSFHNEEVVPLFGSIHILMSYR